MGTEEESLFHEMGVRDQSGLLDADSIPNANQSLTCFSCDEPMTGLFCYACGNKNDNYRRSVWSLGVELFQSLTAFEGRIWKSLYSLILRPGRMARAYADGARQKWTSPMRLFLATSLLLFGYIALSDTQIVALGALEKNSGDRSAAITFGDGEGARFDQRLLFFVRQSDLVPVSQLESIEQSMGFLQGLRDGLSDLQDPESLQRGIDELTEQINLAEDELSKTALIQAREGMVLALEEAMNRAETDTADVDADSTESEASVTENNDNGNSLNITGTDGRSVSLDREGMSELYSRVLRNPQVINNQLNTKLKWAMFFMMPFAMFMGALFIRGRETAMLYDHLVHAAYVHAFSFLLLFAFILLSQFTSTAWLILPYTMILLIYLPISAKRMFKRGWFKSILTALGVGSVYTLIMFFIGAIIVLQALQTVAYEISEGSAAASPSTSTPASTPVPESAPSPEITPTEETQPIPDPEM
ncbi:hypothetical protein GCM10007853_12540 [Algimonas ampicilliniresistens]|uniref:DUF3667 domain-containing protein n=1 Tax=Algimonas ampicilliniresistens TaxID=1298735 RepID=A0ABQ5V8K0_9PROT|nr:DUF3667 domain-containing protein [Algimonas ampicilliniresistens]GLQ23380.1 hypothetical protein GCM10007853_12540 [Algimonas ampicilliniresistens]